MNPDLKIKVNGHLRRDTVRPSQSLGNLSTRLLLSRSHTPVRSSPHRVLMFLRFWHSATGSRGGPGVHRGHYAARTTRKDPRYVGRQVHSSPLDNSKLPCSLLPPLPTNHLPQIIPQSVATLATCRLTEIVSLTDISDVYNVSTGQDPDEFIIRKIRHGITLYFSSPMRDAIIKVCIVGRPPYVVC